MKKFHLTIKMPGTVSENKIIEATSVEVTTGGAYMFRNENNELQCTYPIAFTYITKIEK